MAKNCLRVRSASSSEPSEDEEHGRKTFSQMNTLGHLLEVFGRVVRVRGTETLCTIQAHRTSSNLPEPHHYRDSKVCRVLSHEFGVVRLYRTFSIYIVIGETRHAGCLCTSSGWFKHIEPPRTFPNHIITEIARCVEFCHMSSGWFDCTEPSLSTSL